LDNLDASGFVDEQSWAYWWLKLGSVRVSAEYFLAFAGLLFGSGGMVADMGMLSMSVVAGAGAVAFLAFALINQRPRGESFLLS
jgi:hypothetical protein